MRNGVLVIKRLNAVIVLLGLGKARLGRCDIGFLDIEARPGAGYVCLRRGDAALECLRVDPGDDVALLHFGIEVGVQFDDLP